MIDLQQIFLHIFNFGILGLGLYLLLYKPVVSFMDKRKAEYERREAETQQALEDAESLLQARQSALEGLNAEIQTLKQEKLKGVEEEAQAYLQRSRIQAEAIVEEARKRALSEEKKILAKANEEVKEIVATAVRSTVISEDRIYDEFLLAVDQGQKHD